MIISAHVVKRPRAPHVCSGCREVIDHAPHIVAFECAERGDKPYRIRICMGCASSTSGDTTLFLVAMKHIGDERRRCGPDTGVSG